MISPALRSNLVELGRLRLMRAEAVVEGRDPAMFDKAMRAVGDLVATQRRQAVARAAQGSLGL